MSRVPLLLILLSPAIVWAAPLPQAPRTCDLLAHNPLIINSESRAIYAVWSDPACVKLVPTTPNPLVLLKAPSGAADLPPSLHLYAQITYSDANGNGLVLNVRDIPNLTVGPGRKFDVFISGVAIGSLIVGIDQLRARSPVDVEIVPPKAQQPAVAAAPTRISMTRVRVTPANEKTEGTVLNRVTLEFPPAFVERTDTPGALAWYVEYTSWGDDLTFPRCVPKADIVAKSTVAGIEKELRDSTAPGTDDCYLPSLSTISFLMRTRTEAPLTAKLTLMRFTPSATAGAIDRNAVWTGSIELAPRSGGSTPLPVVDYLTVCCLNEAATNGQVLAIGDNEVRDGACRLGLLQSDRNGKPLAADDVIGLFGEQLLRVTIHRDGTKDPPAQDWLVTATSLKAGFTLPAADDDSAGRGRYEVTVSVLANNVGNVLYEHPVASAGGGRDTSLQFKASLTPRGPFGFPGQKSVRMFFTVPVDVVAARLPASVQDLRSSSEITAVQPIFVKTGLLFALEPWDYRFGRNLWPLPVRVVAGVHLVGVGVNKSGFMPSFVSGVYFTLPLIESVSQVNTSLAIGVLYELDIRDRRSYALLTLGFNVFSFLGANK